MTDTFNIEEAMQQATARLSALNAEIAEREAAVKAAVKARADAVPQIRNDKALLRQLKDERKKLQRFVRPAGGGGGSTSGSE